MTIELEEIYRLSYLAKRYEPNQFSPPAISKQKYTVDCSQLDRDSIYKAVRAFNKYKFVILKSDDPDNDLLLNLSGVFGNMIEQTPVKGSVLYKIESSRVNSTSTKNNTYQPLHSDGNFKPNPPKIITLQCLQHSELGGYTKLVYAEDIYNYIKQISPVILSKLFDKKAITFFRKDRNSKELRIIKYSKPIFYNLDSGRIGISFNPMMSKIESSPSLERMYKLISYFVSKPKNQLTFQLQRGETLIADNFALLHARTAFPEDGGRMLRRAWYDASSDYELKLGFLA